MMRWLVVCVLAGVFGILIPIVVAQSTTVYDFPVGSAPAFWTNANLTYWNPSAVNYTNDHFAEPNASYPRVFSFSYQYSSSNLPVSPYVSSGQSYAILVYLCSGTPPTWPSMFPSTGCPASAVAGSSDGYLGFMSGISGTYDFVARHGNGAKLTNADGSPRYLVVRALYYNFQNTSQIWQQEQQRTPSGVRSIVTFNYGASASSTVPFTKDIRRHFGYCGDGYINGGEQCDAGVGGVARASGNCSAACVIQPSCGTANGVTSYAAPTSNLCASGSSTGVSGSGPWSWSCIAGSQTMACSAPLAQPSCGQSNSGTFVTAPTTNLCGFGTASTLTGSGPWAWNCANAAGTTSCSAKITTPVCGSANGTTVSTAPTTNLCSVGSASNVTGSGPWSWNCANGSLTTSCAAAIPTPTCGSSNGATFVSQPTTNLCSVGAASALTGAGPWSWHCLNGSLTTSCAANIYATPTCGATDGTTVTTKPSSNLCGVGSASAVAGSGPWHWNCTNGPLSTSCAAAIPTPTCGSSNGATFVSQPTTNLCSVGAASALTGAGPWSWHCLNGSLTTSCAANIYATPACGSSNGATFVSAPATNLCSTGSASAITGSGPWGWTCDNGPLSAVCSANKYATPVCGASNGATFVSAPTTNFCALGSASALTGSGPWDWNCTNGPLVTSCSAHKYGTPACGTADGVTVDVAPTTNLCSYGTPTSVSGSGPWTWSCASGPLTASCAAQPTPPVCGSANGVFSAASPTTNLCAVGIPSTPTGVGPWNWHCAHGSLTTSCAAPPFPRCTFATAGGVAAVVAPGATGAVVPTATPSVRSNAFGTRTVVPLTLDASAGSACSDASQLCVRARAESIVAGYRHDTTVQPWSECLNLTDAGISPQYEFDPATKTLYLPVQDRQAYEVAGGLRGTADYDSPSAFFDTRTNYAKIIGSAATLDITAAEIDNAIRPNLNILRDTFNASAYGTVCDITYGATLSSLDPTSSFVRYDAYGIAHPTALAACLNTTQTAAYFHADTPSAATRLTITTASSTLIMPTYPFTIFVEGADIFLKTNLTYPMGKTDGSLGIIALATTDGGDLLVAPSVTNLIGAYYVTGSVKTVDAGGMTPRSVGVSRDNPTWLSTLAHQLYWQGTIVSRNTFLGAGDPTWPRYNVPHCPSANGLTACDISAGLVSGWQIGAEYDLTLLREFALCRNVSSLLSAYGGWQLSGCASVGQARGIRAALPSGVVSDAAVVLRYDARLGSNPPPGFEGLSRILTEEVAP